MAVNVSCLHANKNKKEVEGGSPSFMELQKVTEDKKRLTDVEKLSNFCHTGAVENYHSMMMMMCQKRCHFFYEGMRARTQLAIIRHNFNLDNTLVVQEASSTSAEQVGQRGTWHRMHPDEHNAEHSDWDSNSLSLSPPPPPPPLSLSLFFMKFNR